MFKIELSDRFRIDFLDTGKGPSTPKIFHLESFHTASDVSSPPLGCLLPYALFAENAPAVKAISAPLMRIRRAASCQWSTTMTRSEEHTSELQSLMRITNAVFCLKKKSTKHNRCEQL